MDVRAAVCYEAGAAFDERMLLRMQPGYDHSYYFIASFIEEHLQFHAEELGAM